MPFKDEVAAGDVLVYTALRSEVYSPGAAGWRLTRAGDADLNNVTIRGTLQSANYATNAAGYKLNGTTGDAEVNQLVARGEIATDLPGQARVRMFSSAGSPPPAGVGVIELISAAAAETSPARVRCYGIGGNPSLIIEGPATNPGGTSKWVWTVDSASVFLSAPSALLGLAQFMLSGGQLFIPDAPDASLAGGTGAIEIGYSGSGPFLRIDSNEVLAGDGSSFPAVASTLNLQNEGGLLQVGAPILCSDMRSVDAGSAGNVVTASTTFVTDNTNGPNRTFAYAPSGRALVLISADAVNSGAGFSNMSFRIRDTNAAGTIRFTGGSEETVRIQGTNRATVATGTVVTGLPTSGTGFIEGLYLASSGTATFRNPDIVVIPVT